MGNQLSAIRRATMVRPTVTAETIRATEETEAMSDCPFASSMGMRLPDRLQSEWIPAGLTAGTMAAILATVGMAEAMAVTVETVRTAATVEMTANFRSLVNL